MVSITSSPQHGPPASTYRPAALSPASPPPTCLVRNASDREAHVQVGNTFGSLAADIDKRLGLYNKGMQIRTRRWLEKLHSVSTSNLTWLKNRNNYARLLLEQLRKGRLEKPFNVAPSPGPLPTLPRYLTYSYMPDKRSSRSPSPLKSRMTEGQREAVEASDPRPVSVPDASDVTLSPNPPPLHDRHCAAGPASAGRSAYGADVRDGIPSDMYHRQHSPDTRATASRYSVLSSSEKDELLMKLEYQLSVSRERQLDLEGQLAAASKRIEEQTSEIAAMRYEAQQQKQQPTTPKSTGSDCKRKTARAELDRMISRVQTARQAWESPTAASDKSTPRSSRRAHRDRPADVLSAEGLPSSIRSKLASGRFEDDDDFLQHLEEFQRRTDVLQGQITRMHSSPRP